MILHDASLDFVFAALKNEILPSVSSILQLNVMQVNDKIVQLKIHGILCLQKILNKFDSNTIENSILNAIWDTLKIHNNVVPIIMSCLGNYLFFPFYLLFIFFS